MYNEFKVNSDTVVLGRILVDTLQTPHCITREKKRESEKVSKKKTNVIYPSCLFEKMPYSLCPDISNLTLLYIFVFSFPSSFS
jgi:hypothetical protein